MPNNKTRILFVCAADVSTAQTFINLIATIDKFDIWVFNSLRTEHYPPQIWRHTTISLFRSKNTYNKKHWFQIPDRKLIRKAIQFLDKKSKIIEAFLRLVIFFIKPDIVHSIAINPEGVLCDQAFKGSKSKNRPKWIVSSWSSDIYWDRFRGNYKQQLLDTLAHCDGFIVDNQRDMNIAMNLGLPSHIPTAIILGGGGIPEVMISEKIKFHFDKVVILLPKGYDSIWHKPYVAIEALFQVSEKIPVNKQLSILIIDTNEDFRIWCSLYGDSFYNKIEFKAFLSQSDYFEILNKTDILLAPSLSDGTPNALLESMAIGAFPIFSAHDSIKEWINDGENGFLVNPLDATNIAEKILAAINNDDLRSTAYTINKQIIKNRALRSLQKHKMLEFYDKILLQKK
jgi:Glycosyltransferase